MNFFAFVLLIESHNAQDGRSDHARAVYPSHRLVKFYRTALFGSGDSGSADGIISGDAIQIAGQRTQSNVQIARAVPSLLPPAPGPRITVAIKRNRRDQTHPLMDLQHVRPFIQQRLLTGVSLSLFRSKAQIRKRRRSYCWMGRSANYPVALALVWWWLARWPAASRPQLMA